jgi:hypothetical protein
MTACDLLNDCSFRKLYVNGTYYTDGAPGTKSPSLYRWDLICSICGKTWSLLRPSARSLEAPEYCACGGTGMIAGIPEVAYRG